MATSTERARVRRERIRNGVAPHACPACGHTHYPCNAVAPDATGNAVAPIAGNPHPQGNAVAPIAGNPHPQGNAVAPSQDLSPGDARDRLAAMAERLARFAAAGRAWQDRAVRAEQALRDNGLDVPTG